MSGVIWFSLAALLLFVVLAQACASWPIRADWIFRRGGALKRQELKQSISDRGGIKSCSTGQYEGTDIFLSIKAYKLILVETQNKVINPQKKKSITLCFSVYIPHDHQPTVLFGVLIFHISPCSLLVEVRIHVTGLITVMGPCALRMNYAILVASNTMPDNDSSVEIQRFLSPVPGFNPKSSNAVTVVRPRGAQPDQICFFSADVYDENDSKYKVGVADNWVHGSFLLLT